MRAATMRRLLLTLAAVLLLAWVVSWLASRHAMRFTLGRGDQLVAMDGVDGFAVREDDGLWRLFDAAARAPQDGVRLPAGLAGRPVLAPDGSAWSLVDGALLRTAGARAGGATVHVLPDGALPAGARLAGLAAGETPVLALPDVDGLTRLSVLLPAVPDGAPARVVELRDALGPAALPAGAVESDVACTPAAPVVALRTARGWEAWSWDAAGAARRVLAEGCDQPGALFTPDGRALVVPGRVAGLWTLSLADGRMAQMAEGNLGLSRRVPPSSAFRGGGEHRRLVAPQWNLDGWLQVYQTHLFGGGRYSFGLSFTHHYGLALSADGRFMAYCQAAFDEASDAPFEEDLFVVDFEESVTTVAVGARHGGQAQQGPHFVGRGASLVYLADGEVQRIEMLPPDPGAEEP